MVYIAMAVSVDELLRKAQSSLKAGKPSKAADIEKGNLSNG